jgi:hypothetical protein
VYGILTFQVLLTVISVGTVVAVPALRDFIVNTPGLYLILAISPIVRKFCVSPFLCWAANFLISNALAHIKVSGPLLVGACGLAFISFWHPRRAYC